MFEGMSWEHGQDQLTVLAGRPLTGLSPLQAADALLRIDPLALLDLDQAVAETVIADLQTALNQLTALQAIFIETVARRVEADVEIAKDADRLAGRFPAGWGTGDDYTPSVLAPLLHVAPRTMAGRVADARILVNDLPRTLRAGLTGDLEPWRVQAIITGSLGVSPARMPDYEVAVFGEHGIGDVTASALRKRAEKAAARIDPDSLAQRVQAGRRSHTVRVAPGVLPGTTDWTATAATETSLQAWAAVCALADEYAVGNPDLSVGQARADAFLDLLLRRVQVQTVVTINITDTTLTHLAGPAPTTATATAVSATTAGSTTTAATAKAVSAARAVALPEPAFPYLPADRHPPHTRTALTHTIFTTRAPDTHPAIDPLTRPPGIIDTGPCGWLPTTEVAAILTHPDTLIRLARLHPTTGATTHLSTDTYRPGAALARLVRDRDGTCRFPGCTTPATHCDLDHAIPYPQGPTTPNNLHALCRRHHGFKHHAGWTIHINPDNATLTWTSPTGRTYTTHPHDKRDTAA
ncbi:MAG: HNH endonuclease [Actinomycetales bacterium]|jgi:hypothetical protein|nr:HNH endonuclease [Candidatus Phosphoribacter baldrii]